MTMTSSSDSDAMILPRETGEGDRHPSRACPTWANPNAKLGNSRVWWRWRGQPQMPTSRVPPPPRFARSPYPAPRGRIIAFGKAVA
jgi:hypothetical protein